MDGKKFLKVFFMPTSITAMIICLVCIAFKTNEIINKNLNNIEIMAGSIFLPYKQCNKPVKTVSYNDLDFSEITKCKALKWKNTNEKKQESQNYLSTLQDEPPLFEIPHADGEATYKIIESHFGASGTKYENFFVNNKTGLDLNIAEELSRRPDINLKRDGSPEILIVHTHTCEAFMDKNQGFYYESFHPRTENCNYNVVRVGDEICKSLEKSGFGTVHDITCHDSPSFNGSYNRSAKTIDENLKKYPSIQVVLDIHRDTIGNNERGKIKPTFSVGEKKAAQIMIIAGCDTDGTLSFPDWEYNLRFALRLQRSAETLYPGMTRSLLFKKAKYNMNKTHGSLLIEVGSDVNTLNEAIHTGEFIGNALADVFNGL